MVFVDPSAANETVRKSLGLVKIQGFIGVAKAHLLRLTIPEIRSIPQKFHTTGWVPRSRPMQSESDQASAPAAVSAKHSALITFTSGSTGQPKAVCRSHGFLISQHKALEQSLDLKDEEIDLITLPVFAIANLASGLTSVIADTDLRFPARANSQAIVKQCRQFKVTRCAASPAFFEKLHGDSTFPCFKAIYTGGAPVFPHKIEQIHQAYPDLRIITVFGSTEAEPIADIPWNQVSHDDRVAMQSGKGLLVGKPVPATKVTIIPDQFGNPVDSIHDCPTGTVGEIIVTGDHVLKGYLNGHGNEETKITIENSTWHRTGDAGFIDESGRLWLSGRCSAAIRRKGKETIYPFGIECAASSNQHIEKCALINRNDESILYIQLSNPYTDISTVRRELEHLDIDKIVAIPSIPMDLRHNAKVDYVALRQMIS